MEERVWTIPELTLITGTRVTPAWAQVCYSRINSSTGAGWALLGVGALSTSLFAMNVLGKSGKWNAA